MGWSQASLLLAPATGVFSLPKRLRLIFLYNRNLLAKLSQCAWRVLSCYLKQSVSIASPTPGAVIAVQTFGDLLNFNPHLHIIATDGCFQSDGIFMIGATPDANDLEDLFRSEVLKMLLQEGKITDATIKNMDSWHHSGFHVYCGEAIKPDDHEGIERLAQYIIRAPISQERMLYIPAAEALGGMAQVVYTGKNSGVQERFIALDWLVVKLRKRTFTARHATRLARLVTHIPNKGEQMVRYYGYYANKTRGVRKKEEAINKKDDGTEASQLIPNLINSDISRKAFRQNWARLIQKIYHADPLLCPKCHGTMRIISFIEEQATVKKILMHLNLWMPGNHDPPANPLAQDEASQEAHSHNIIELAFNRSTRLTHEASDTQSPYEDEYSQVTSNFDD
jgi:hypothetical protein